MEVTHMSRIFGILCCVALLVNQANASLTIVSVVGGQPASGVNYANFDNLPLDSAVGGVSGGITVSLSSNAQVVDLPNTGQYAAPFISNSNGLLFGDNTISGQDKTPYITSGSTGSVATASATLDFVLVGAQQYLGLLWGSVDNYNTLTFHFTDNTTESITGSDITAFANGDQGVSGTYYVNINSSKPFSKVVATSSNFAFEFDNVAYSASPIPEASTIAVWSVLSLVGAGVAYRKRSQKLA
jgi:hypothetical protein